MYLYLAADTNAERSSSPITPHGKQLLNEDAFSASGAWRPVLSRTSPIAEDQLHTVQERRRYNKNIWAAKATDTRPSSGNSAIDYPPLDSTNIWAAKATDPRPSSGNSAIDYPPLDSTNRHSVLSFVPEQVVHRNSSIRINGNRKGIYLRAHTRRSVNATKMPASLKNNGSSNFNWKQRLQIPAATRIVLSRILNSFNGSSSNTNKSVTPNVMGDSKPKRIHVVPLGLFSSLTKNAQNISSQLHKILLNRLKNKTNPSELHLNSTAVNKIKGNDSLTVDNEQFWSPVTLTSSRLSTNESVEGSFYIKSNSSKKLGGTKRYSVLTSFDNTHEAYNGTYIVYTKGNTSKAFNTLKSMDRFKSNSSKASDATSWVPILQPAKGDSKLLNHSILAEPENDTNYSAINASDAQDALLKPPNTATSSGENSHVLKQNNNTSTGIKKSKLTDIFPGDSKLVKTFLANNMQDLRIPNNKYPNKGIEKVDTAQYSSTIPPTETKRWPGGTSGIQTLDDLILYHTYTSGLNEKPKPTAWTPQVNPNRPMVTMLQQPGGGYVGIIKKPAVTIHNSHWGYESSSTRPPEDNQNATRPSKPSIILSNKPYSSKPSTNSHHPNYRPTYGEHEPDHDSPKPPSPSMYPVVLITPRPTPAHKPSTPLYHYPSTHYQVTTPYPAHQSSPQPSNCPNIVITTNGNFTASGKEKCPDVNIMITSGFTNNNVVVSGPPTTTESSVTPFPGISNGGTVTQNPPGLFQPGNGVLSSVTSAMMSMLNPLQYPLLYFMIAPVMVIVAGGIGIAALLFPWAFGRRSGRKKRLEKKTVSYPQPKPRRRRSFSFVDYFPEDIVYEAVMEFERNFNASGVWKHSDILRSASRNVKAGVSRRKTNDTLINYYWWWLKSDT